MRLLPELLILRFLRRRDLPGILLRYTQGSTHCFEPTVHDIIIMLVRTQSMLVDLLSLLTESILGVHGITCIVEVQNLEQLTTIMKLISNTVTHTSHRK